MRLVEAALGDERFDPQAEGASPDEVARTIAFLASAESSLATGAQFVIDCGQLAGSTGL